MRWKVRVCSTRRSLTWRSSEISPISSRKTDPSGGQVSSHPVRSSTAPVNEPLRWPKSSDSTSVGDSADRLRAMKEERKSSTNAWRRGSKGMKRDMPMARATSSLPVPEGPVMSVVKSPMRE